VVPAAPGYWIGKLPLLALLLPSLSVGARRPHPVRPDHPAALTRIPRICPASREAAGRG
jgi:hypothetical protein